MVVDVDLLMKISALLVSAGAFALSLVAMRTRSVDKEMDATTTAVHNNEVRITAIERALGSLQQTVEHLPGKSEIHRLEITLTQISGQMGTIGATMEGQREIMQRLEAIVSRHEDHLLEGKR